MLSDDYLWKQSEKTMIGGSIHIIRFARAIESEVRKQDTALIRQLVEALEKADKISCYPNNKKPITAARAWLEDAK